jgi:hypothetical protein
MDLYARFEAFAEGRSYTLGTLQLPAFSAKYLPVHARETGRNAHIGFRGRGM